MEEFFCVPGVDSLPSVYENAVRSVISLFHFGAAMGLQHQMEESKCKAELTFVLFMGRMDVSIVVFEERHVEEEYIC